jgi:hypothetical protein
MFLEDLAKALKSAQVKYALVGGYAVAFQGAARGTLDVDITIALTKDSFEQAEKALKSIGLVSRLPVSATEVFHFRKEYISNRNLIAWSFYNPKSPSEILDIIITEDARKIKAERFYVNNTPLMVASKIDLIKMKKRSARPQDLLDVDALERLLNGKK